MASYYKKGPTYTVVYRLPGFARKYICGIKTEKLAARTMQAKELEEQLVRTGHVRPDPEADQIAAAATIPIHHHIKDFAKDILAKGKTKQHAQQQAAHCHRLFKMARINGVDRIERESLQRAIDRLHGPKCGPRTCNAARQAVIQFERYLKDKGAIRQTGLQNLERLNEVKDIRRKRRPLNEEEVHWLLRTTESLQDRTAERCGLSSIDRAVLYSVGIGTGFRQKALLSLTKSSFNLTNVDHPSVRLAAKFNKNGKDREQLIPLGLGEHLKDWLNLKPDSGPVWRPRPHANLALRYRRDLEAARAAWIDAAKSDSVERVRRERSDTLKYVFNDGSRNVYADFHGLRHTGITFVVRSAGIRVGQEWADHSTPLLTARYAEVDRADLLKGLAGLPKTIQSQTDSQKLSH